MKMWINALSAETLKYKRSSFFWLHIIIPIFGAGIVYLYYHYTKSTSDDSLFMYLTLVAAAYPFMISVVSSISFRIEEESGFYLLLSAINRKVLLGAKLFLIYILGCCTTILAEIFIPLLIGTMIDPMLFWGIFLVISVPNMILYIVHSFLYLRYGKSISIFAGVCGTMVSMLFLTGIGDGIWKLVPSSMGMRATNLLLLIAKNKGQVNAYQNDFKEFPWICIVELIAVIVLFFYWIQRWDGRKVYE